MFKSLTFDNVNSLDYGVHINGEGVYNAPERDVEMISIPGRDGDYALDHGRFHNIDVTYPAGIGEISQTDFADKISAFRNALASRRGYCRLEDDYHPDEFRMGVYKSGLEASPVMYNRAGEFDLVFNCKPQRFLKSGEQRTEFTQDGTINNPTLFESKPLLELYGYGTLNVNGSEITLHNEPLGHIILRNDINVNQGTIIATRNFDSSLVNNGDGIEINAPVVTANASFSSVYSSATRPNITTSHTSGMSFASVPIGNVNGNSLTATISFNNVSFTMGTGKTVSAEGTFRTTLTNRSTSATTAATWTINISIQYDGADTFTITLNSTTDYLAIARGPGLTTGELTAESTVLPLGSPLYLDCEIGEAYKEENGQITLINKNVDIPSDLPVLSPGTNEITMDDTFTKVNVIPRWWII